MKKVMMKMTILMGVTMSFVLSLVGTISSGHFSIPSWMISFCISLIISLVIGFLVPVKKIGDKVCRKCKVNPQSLKGNLLSSLISDLIYTPIITIIMVVVMLNMAAAHVPEGVVPPVGVVLVPSLLICFVIGYIVIAIVQPIYIKVLMRNIRVVK